MPLEVTRGPRMRGKSSFAAGAAKNLGIIVKTTASSSSSYGSDSSRRDRMLRHYTSIAETGVSFKDRKAQRSSMTVTDAEVQAALPPTRLGLRSTMSIPTQVDSRSYSRKGQTTQVGSNLTGSNVEKRSANYTYGPAIKEFASRKTAPIAIELEDMRAVKQKMRDEYQTRLKMESIHDEEPSHSEIDLGKEDFEDYFASKSAEELQREYEIASLAREVREKKEKQLAQRTPNEELDDWLFPRDSTFIKAYWKKNPETFKRHTCSGNIDVRMKMNDAISHAAEIGDTEILEVLLDHSGVSSAEARIDEAGKQRIMELLDGEDASTGMFSSTALHKAAYRGKYDMVRLLLKLGCDPNLQGKSMDTRGGATALDSCIFGLSSSGSHISRGTPLILSLPTAEKTIPPDVGKYATAMNRLDYFEDHFKVLLYLIAGGAKPELSMCNGLQGGIFYQIFQNILENLKPNHIPSISARLQYDLVVVFEALWNCGYRITEDVLIEAGEEYNWVNSLEMVKKMIQVKGREVMSLSELARNASRGVLRGSLAMNQIPKWIPYRMRRWIAFGELYEIPM
ncbi:Oidioi.mRNA.OKI2018_I69.chr1.g3667.t1.cds [Oikopleura dioica]|uniref:Oidioi.mRNA.OKI2018_I69.chr1.g3667.t1.cds n=1 Tax=Oikopleura dioica TaxID=34765 RepID=A0ABN7T0E2_OIKDI|nr:Oidioi.mRNA.OKI2018_I69.chr1.g3667.t1.cds [Oikopleura dioica]